MTPNHSLDLSLQLQNLIRTDLLQQISIEFPFELMESNTNKDASKKRDRVFNDGNTLLTMLVTAVNEDKSLKQSVNIFKQIFESRGEHILKKEKEDLEKRRLTDITLDKKMGRPKLYQSRLAKSKTQPVSDNTAAYTKARQRLDYHLVQQVFDYSKDFTGIEQPLWHGMKTYNSDGTYCQMQDSEELGKKYHVKEGGAYPQLLLEGIVQQGTGQIVCFEIGSRYQSELELIAKQLHQLPQNSLLLADDLYNSYAVFAMMQRQGCHLIVPGKRGRAYKVIEKIAEGDELVEISRTDIPKWWQQDWELPKKLFMRRIAFLSPVDGETEWVQYTTLVDKSITKADIIAKYISRWDIEITIREIKTLMDINVIRSKSEEMVFKEITIALAAYNMMRKIIAKSVDKTDFSPKEDIIQKFFEANKTVLIDKKGRIYNRWSPGRYGQATQPN